MAQKLRAFHGDPQVQQRYLERVRAHQAADHFEQGFGYWDGTKGCGVGCTLERFPDRTTDSMSYGYDSLQSDSWLHARYEEELGIPRELAVLEDQLFEALHPNWAKLWPVRFLEAIPLGADLSLIHPLFLLRILRNPRIIPLSQREFKYWQVTDHWLSELAQGRGARIAPRIPRVIGPYSAIMTLTDEKVGWEPDADAVSRSIGLTHHLQKAACRPWAALFLGFRPGGVSADEQHDLPTLPEVSEWLLELLAAAPVPTEKDGEQ